MPAERPGAATAAGVLAVIYGALFTLCSLCGALNLVAKEAIGNQFGNNDPAQAKVQQDVEDALENGAPAYREYQVASTTANLLFALAMLVGGIGVFSLQPWARTTVLITSTILILLSIFQAAYNLGYVLPALNDFFENAMAGAMQQKGAAPPPDFMQFLKIFMGAAITVAVILYFLAVAYLSIIIVLLLRPHVRAAFAGEFPAESERGYLDTRGYEDDRGWRPPDSEDRPDDWRHR